MNYCQRSTINKFWIVSSYNGITPDFGSGYPRSNRGETTIVKKSENFSGLLRMSKICSIFAEKLNVRMPEGFKGAVCKTVIHRFKSDSLLKYKNGIGVIGSTSLIEKAKVRVCDTILENSWNVRKCSVRIRKTMQSLGVVGAQEAGGIHRNRGANMSFTDISTFKNKI